MGRFRQSLLIGLPLMLVAVLLPRKAHARKPPAKTNRTAATHSYRRKKEQVHTRVDRIRFELSIPDPVAVSLVELNDLVVTVARAADRTRGFELALEERFVNGLSDVELEAVIAHELGHVWI